MNIQRPLALAFIGILVREIEVEGASFIYFNFTVDVEVGDLSEGIAGIG